LEKWAAERQLYRLELTVMTHNERAIRLYRRLGFEIEGTKRDSLWVDGSYVDEYCMSKLLQS
jgi:RimJ/RimL family protein N-acetyltransferase